VSQHGFDITIQQFDDDKPEVEVVIRWQYENGEVFQCQTLRHMSSMAQAVDFVVRWFNQRGINFDVDKHSDTFVIVFPCEKDAG
jgi:hypothetical protein